MDHESCQDESPHSLDQHLVNIKDYSQHEQSEHEEDSPFDDLEHILGQDENRQTRNEYLLAERVTHLEQDCHVLKEKNLFMSQQIKDLTVDLQQYEQLAKDDPEDEGVVEAIEKQLSEFKVNFEQYRTKQSKITLEKDSQIQRLKQELEKITQEKTTIEQERNSLNDANEDIIKSNENLILQIEKLENELMESRSEIHSSRSYRYNPRRDHGFESEVQAQLEILIEKLMAELQLERNQKKRLNDEIKRMQRETMLLEKEITSKNNKIYELQMSNLKSNRSVKVTSTPYSRPNEDRQSRYGKMPRNQPTSKSDRSQTSTKTLNLMQLLNGDEIQDRQRLIISSKLIDFYSRKVSNKDFACYQLQNLLVCNYNKSNPNILSIRKNTASGITPQQSSQEKMLYNLGQILDILLGEYLSQVKEEDSGEEYLLNLINEIISDKTVNLNDIYVIKQLIEDCLKTRK